MAPWRRGVAWGLVLVRNQIQHETDLLRAGFMLDVVSRAPGRV